MVLVYVLGSQGLGFRICSTVETYGLRFRVQFRQNRESCESISFFGFKDSYISSMQVTFRGQQSNMFSKRWYNKELKVYVLVAGLGFTVQGLGFRKSLALGLAQRDSSSSSSPNALHSCDVNGCPQSSKRNEMKQGSEYRCTTEDFDGFYTRHKVKKSGG